MLVEYVNNAQLSNFEMELVKHFRDIMQHGYGRLEVIVHDGRVKSFEPHRHYEREKLLEFQEAQ